MLNTHSLCVQHTQVVGLCGMSAMLCNVVEYLDFTFLAQMQVEQIQYSAECVELGIIAWVRAKWSG